MQDLVIRGGHVLTIDPDRGDVPGGDVVVLAGRIAVVGRDQAMHVGARVIDATGRVVMPGLVDTHRHVWLGGLFGAVGGQTLLDYAQTVNAERGGRFDPDEVYAGVSNAPGRTHLRWWAVSPSPGSPRVTTTYSVWPRWVALRRCRSAIEWAWSSPVLLRTWSWSTCGRHTWTASATRHSPCCAGPGPPTSRPSSGGELVKEGGRLVGPVTGRARDLLAASRARLRSGLAAA